MNCLYCHKPLDAESRTNKKFCNSFHRIAYHNDIKKKDDEEINSIKNTLLKNWKILKEKLGTERFVFVEEKVLKEEGFNFKFHTHHFLNEKNEEYTYCFNYGWLKTSRPGECLIVRTSKDSKRKKLVNKPMHAGQYETAPLSTK